MKGREEKNRNKSRLEVGSGEKNKQKASDINLGKTRSLKALNTLFTPLRTFSFDLSICSQRAQAGGQIRDREARVAPQKAQVPAAPLSLQMDLLTQPTDPVSTPHPPPPTPV